MSYEANIATILNTKCILCHKGASAPNGLDMSTYANLMKGGADGAVIIPGDSANSPFIKIQSTQHFANLSPEELDLFKQWIDAGALEK